MNTKQVIVIRKDLNMRKGKMVAQGSHASMQFLVEEYITRGVPNDLVVRLTSVQAHWIIIDRPKVTVSVNSELELMDLIAKARTAGIDVRSIIDKGRTEFKGVPTLTCAAFGPDEVEKLDLITGHLPLL